MCGERGRRGVCCWAKDTGRERVCMGGPLCKNGACVYATLETRLGSGALPLGGALRQSVFLETALPACLLAALLATTRKSEGAY